MVCQHGPNTLHIKQSCGKVSESVHQKTDYLMYLYHSLITQPNNQLQVALVLVLGLTSLVSEQHW